MTERPRAMRDALLARICEEMGRDEQIFFVTADFGSPVLDKIRADYPDRFLNVGIAEQNLINVSAGLALEGYKVFAYAIAPFITMRCFEQIRISLAILSQVRDMNVNLIGVGAGFSYVVSGPTHQCFEDLTLMRSLPSMAVYSPSDDLAAAALLEPCMAQSGPKYLRLDAQVLPRIKPVGPDESEVDSGFRLLRNGAHLCLLATGYMTHTALLVADALRDRGIEAGVLDLISLTSLDRTRLLELIGDEKPVVSLEEGFSGRGGLDALVLNLLNQSNTQARVLTVGIEGPHTFELGTRNHLHHLAGIDADTVLKRVVRFIERG